MIVHLSVALTGRVEVFLLGPCYSFSICDGISKAGVTSPLWVSIGSTREKLVVNLAGTFPNVARTIEPEHVSGTLWVTDTVLLTLEGGDVSPLLGPTTGLSPWMAYSKISEELL